MPRPAIWMPMVSCFIERSLRGSKPVSLAIIFAPASPSVAFGNWTLQSTEVYGYLLQVLLMLSVGFLKTTKPRWNCPHLMQLVSHTTSSLAKKWIRNNLEERSNHAHLRTKFVILKKIISLVGFSAALLYIHLHYTDTVHWPLKSLLNDSNEEGHHSRNPSTWQQINLQWWPPHFLVHNAAWETEVLALQPKLGSVGFMPKACWRPEKYERCVSLLFFISCFSSKASWIMWGLANNLR